MAIWQTARTDRRTRPRPAGWPGRSTVGPARRATRRALHIHEAFPLPRSLAGGRQVIPSLARLEQFRRRLGMPQGAEAAAQIEALDRLARQDRGEPGSLLQFVERCSLITYASSARLERVQQDRHRPPRSSYPEFYGLARRLRLIAQLIKAGLSTPIYYTHLDGFDTHSGQLQQHANLLRELGASLKAFLDDLEKSGESDRVLVLVFSEFGRRLGENGSGGTDHGTAAPVFLLGQPGQGRPARPLPRPDPPRGRRPDPRRRLPPRLRDRARPLAGRPPSRGPRRGLRADAGAAKGEDCGTMRSLKPLPRDSRSGENRPCDRISPAASPSYLPRWP